jgi:hypothetical protein
MQQAVQAAGLHRRTVIRLERDSAAMSRDGRPVSGG